MNCAHHSLQAAINNALAGSTVLVSGHCTANFTVTKNLTIRGNPTATLDARGHGRVVQIEAGHDTLRSLTVTGGSGESAIFSKGGRLKLVDVTITHNVGGDGQGGALKAFESPVTMVRWTVTHNSTHEAGESDGGAIYTDALSPITVTDSVTSNNTDASRRPPAMKWTAEPSSPRERSPSSAQRSPTTQRSLTRATLPMSPAEH